MIRQYVKLFLESDFRKENNSNKKEKSFVDILNKYIEEKNKNKAKVKTKNDPGNILNPDDVGYYNIIKKKS